MSHSASVGANAGTQVFVGFIYYPPRSDSIFEARLIVEHLMRLFWQRASSIDRFLLLALVAGAAFTLNGMIMVGMGRMLESRPDGATQVDTPGPWFLRAS